MLGLASDCLSRPLNKMRGRSRGGGAAHLATRDRSLQVNPGRLSPTSAILLCTSRGMSASAGKVLQVITRFTCS